MALTLNVWQKPDLWAQLCGMGSINDPGRVFKEDTGSPSLGRSALRTLNPYQADFPTRYGRHKAHNTLSPSLNVLIAFKIRREKPNF